MVDGQTGHRRHQDRRVTDIDIQNTRSRTYMDIQNRRSRQCANMPERDLPGKGADGMAGSSQRSRVERPSESAGRAKLLLGIEPRTARKHIRNFVENLPGTKLEGFIIPGAHKDEYRFYTDSGTQPGQGDGPDTALGARSEIDALRTELAEAREANARLQMRADESDSARRELVAAHALHLEATAEFRRSAEHALKGAEHLEGVLAIYRNQLAQYLTPDDLRLLLPPL